MFSWLDYLIVYDPTDVFSNPVKIPCPTLKLAAVEL
jgi:hypothetical protein